MNKYYIVLSNDENLPQLIERAVGDSNSQRYSVDGTRVLLKTSVDYPSDCPLFSNYTPIELTELHTILSGSDWTQTFLITQI